MGVLDTCPSIKGARDCRPGSLALSSLDSLGRRRIPSTSASLGVPCSSPQAASRKPQQPSRSIRSLTNVLVRAPTSLILCGGIVGYKQDALYSATKSIESGPIQVLTSHFCI